MKNLLFIRTAIFIFMGLLLNLGIPADVICQIVSTPEGGNWNSTATWVGGVIPGAADNVIIASAVNVTGGSQCNDLTVQSGGLLQNATFNQFTLTVNGNLNNQGTVSNNASYSLSIDLKGNMVNSGTMSNNTLRFFGTGNQVISSSQPLSIANLIRTAGSGNVIATTNLDFIGTIINFNNDTLEFTTGSAISLNGGYTQNCILYRTAGSPIQYSGENGTYIDNIRIVAPQTVFSGNILVSGSTNVLQTSLTNNGTLENRPINSFTLTIAGNITNNGTIKNNDSYYLSVNISGDLTNNGVWSNTTTTLNGSGTQLLSMTQPFSGSNFVKTASPGRAAATSALSFTGTNINFNNDTIEFTTGSAISQDGGFIQNCILYRTAGSPIQYSGENGTYIDNIRIVAPQTVFSGNILVSGSTNVLQTSLTNNGTLENRSINSFTLTIAGNITNNGTIKNSVNYSLSVNISGNFTNNGAWSNTTTTLNGSGTQLLSMTQPFSGSNFVKTAFPGRAAATSVLSFTGTNINFNNDTIEFTTGSAISLNGGNLRQCVLFRTLPSPIRITGGNDTYIESVGVNAPQTEFVGSVLVSSGNSLLTSLTNNGILRNRNINTFTLNVNGSLTNNGTIMDNTSYNLGINITGDITNNGLWKNTTTTLAGTNDRTITCSSAFSGANFTKSSATGNITALTSIEFSGATVNFGGSLLTFPDEGMLSVSNGSFGNAVIDGSSIRFYMQKSYCQTTQFNTAVTLLGTFVAGANVAFNGDVLNQGTLMNHTINSFTVAVAGNLENFGTIANNNFYTLSLNISGNITNNGIWNNNQTTLNGTSDQYIYLNNQIDGRLRLDAGSGTTGTWQGPSGSLAGNAGFSGATTQILTFLTAVTNSAAGQYYRAGTSGNSRSFFINTQANPARMVTLNFLIEGLYDSGGAMKTALDLNGQPVFGSGNADQVTIELRSASNFSNILYKREFVLLSTNGEVSFIVPGNMTASYYLSIRHHNSLLTTSAAPVSFGSTNVSYNFDAPSKAFGNNLTQTHDGFFALYSGDVNQDGVIDTGDMTIVDNRSMEFSEGYQPSDLNGDGVVDTADMTIVDNNSSNFVSVIVP